MKRTPPPPPGAAAPPMRLVPIRGPSGKVWGMLDPGTMVAHFKHGRIEDCIDLSIYAREARTKS